MKTELLEFKNKSGATLRGMLTKYNSKKTVILIHGFEGTATQKKFKLIADELSKREISSLRFDYEGCGISDGNFRSFTVKRMTQNFAAAISAVRRENNSDIIIPVAHSLSACVIADYLSEKNQFDKIALMAPALNQKDLLRYWFVQSNNKDKAINWHNYRGYLKEQEFMRYCRKKGKMTGMNYLDSEYFIENIDKDYSHMLNDYSDRILLIHGQEDDVVPLESINVKFRNRVIVKKGDHDLERPDIVSQWLGRCINFLSN